MLLLVGLGNPGAKYARNRHNVGFMAADAIIRRHSFSPERARFQAMVSEGTLSGEKVLVMKPTTYMNESGRAVGEAMRFFKLSPADVVGDGTFDFEVCVVNPSGQGVVRYELRAFGE